jgi:DNA topoisomerase-1
VDGDRVVLEFEGKSGKSIKREVRDTLLARAIEQLQRLGGRRLFTAPDVNGTVKPITAREVNSFIAAASGADVSAKDFRTFRASAEVALLAEQENGTEKLRKVV